MVHEGSVLCAFILLGGEGGREPVKTLVETVSGGGAGGLNVPLAGAEGVEAELVGDLADAHGVGQILLVGKDKEGGVAELVLTEHLLELLVGLSNSVSVV